MEYHKNDDNSLSKSPVLTHETLITNLFCFSTVLITLFFMFAIAYRMKWLDVLVQQSGLNITSDVLLGYVFVLDLFLIIAICFIITNERALNIVENLFGIRKIDIKQD